MPNIEERLQSVKQFIDNSNGSLEDAMTFLGRFKSLHEEVLANYGPGDAIYHEAKSLLSTAFCWLATEYGMQAESELLFGSARYHMMKAGEK